MFRHLKILPAALLLPLCATAQENSPSPSPSPAASPAPSPSPAEAAAPAEVSPAQPAASPAEDVIPLPDGGAPAQPVVEPLPEPLAPADQAMPDAAFTDPNAIIPDEAPPAPNLAGAAQNDAEEKRKNNIRYREVRIQAEKDPAVISMQDQADAARTDEDKRAALREYYRLLFKRMVSIDKSLEEQCRQMESAYLRRLAQYRLEPTIPLRPPPTPEPLN